MWGGGVAVHTDYANQPRTAYFCQEGMFVLLMIRFPSQQITVPYIHIYTIPPRLKSLRAPCLSQFFFSLLFTMCLKYGPRLNRLVNKELTGI